MMLFQTINGYKYDVADINKLNGVKKKTLQQLYFCVY